MKIEPQWIDKIVCDWTFENGHSFTEVELISLVKTLTERLNFGLGLDGFNVSYEGDK